MTNELQKMTTKVFLAAQHCNKKTGKLTIDWNKFVLSSDLVRHVFDDCLPSEEK